MAKIFWVTLDGALQLGSLSQCWSSS